MRDRERGVVVKWLIVLLAGCGQFTIGDTHGEMRTGPAMTRPMHRLVALPATCGSMYVDYAPVAARGGNPAYATDPDTRKCAGDALAGVDQNVRAELDFEGFDVVDTNTLDAVTAKRHEVIERRGNVVSDRIETRGALFEDATPREQHEILNELGADGVVTTRVLITAQGEGGHHEVIVDVQVTAASDRALVWAHQCRTDVAAIGDTISVERGARCAVKR